MRLRSRLVLVLLVTAVPLVAGIVWLRDQVDRWVVGQMMRELAQERIESMGREWCEASPEALTLRFGPPDFRPPFVPERGAGEGADGPPPPVGPRPWWRGRPRMPEGAWPRLPGGSDAPGGRRLVEVFAYDARFVPSAREAPALSPALRRRLSSARDSVSFSETVRGEPWQTIAIHTGWDSGPCAYILLRGPRPRRLPREASFLWSAIALAVGLVATVWIAVGPVIRRVRRLAREVRASAGTRYEQAVPVEGHDEVTDLAQAFNAAGAEVRTHLVEVGQREEALRSFLANTTHDLAIPLSVLLGHLSAMRRALEKGGAITEAQVAAASDEASHLGALVHNLGAAAKLEAGAGLVRRDTVDLGTLLERVVERHRPLAHARGVELVSAIPPDAPVAVAGDLTLLEQALGNLVANAVLYNHAGGHVAVLLETPRADPPRFRLKVVDDGPGVETQELARLGERHFRGQAGRAGRVEGQGLGLHIARQVTERHGFELTFAPSEGGGLAASIEGPREPAPGQTP